MSNFLRTSCIAALLALGVSGAAQANLIVNGSFESGTPQPGGGGFSTIPTGGAAIDGWSVTGGTVDWINGYWQAAAGTHSIDLDGNSPGTISQVISTAIGARYRLSFQYAGNPDNGGYVHEMLVDVRGNGSAVGLVSSSFDFDTTGRSRSDMGWLSSGDVVFVADASATRVSFQSLSTSICCWGVAIDDVVVELAGPGGAADVSSPAGLPLLAGAIGSLAWLRRRGA